MPVILSASVSTVCLAPGSTDPDQYQDQAAIVLGWEIPAASSGTGTGTETAATTLQQALVAIVGSGECRSDSTIGQFSSANTLCVTTGSGASGAPVIYTCPVSQVLSSDNLIHFPTCLKKKLICIIQIMERRWRSSCNQYSSSNSRSEGCIYSSRNQQLH